MADVQKLNVPRPDDLEELLTALLGKNVTVKRLPPGQIVTGEGSVATYFDADGTLRAAIRSELKTVNACGAALSMIPAGAVEDANDEGEIPPNMWDNYYEVQNIMASIFNDKRQRADHVRLREVLPSADISAETSDLLTTGGSRLDVVVSVANGYGGAGLSVVVK